MSWNDMDNDEKELVGALRALAREQEKLRAPDHVEERLMGAWDAARAGRPPRPNLFGRPVLQAAAAFVLAASVGYWWMREDSEPLSQSAIQEPIATTASWSPDETAAWLDPEPGSLQIVRVGVPIATLAAQGYAVSDPDADGFIEVEMIVGADGVARSIRVATTAALY